MKKVVFQNFKPDKILEAIEKIGIEEKLQISSRRLHIYIKKVYKGNKLDESKLRRVFLGITEVNDIIKTSEGLNIFYRNLISLFSSIKNINIDKWIYPIKESLLSTYKELSNHNYLKNGVVSKIPKDIEFNSLGNKLALNYIRSDEKMEKYYEEKIYKFFIDSEQGIKSIYEEIGIPTISDFYYSTVINIVQNNILNILLNKKTMVYSREVKKVILEDFPLKDKDIIFKRILNYYYKEKIHVREFNDYWFDYILEENKTFTSKRWDYYTTEEKSTFKKWLNYKNVKDFFEKHAIYPDRRDYWFEWLNHIEDVVFIKAFKTALIMKFKEHLIIEFGEVGAVRIYDKNILSIEEIEKTFETYAKTRAMQKISYAYKEIDNSRWKHVGQWQWQFNIEMSRLGYKNG